MPGSLEPGGPGGGDRPPGTGGSTGGVMGGGNSAANLASSDEDVIRGVPEAHRRMVNYHIPTVLASSLTVTDEVPGDMALDQASVGQAILHIGPLARSQYQTALA